MMLTEQLTPSHPPPSNKKMEYPISRGLNLKKNTRAFPRGQKRACHNKVRAVNPPRLQILRIDGEGMIYDVRMHMAHDIIRKKKRHEKDVVGFVTFDPPITLLLLLQWHTGVCEETFDVNSKIAQTTQSIWNFIVRKSNLQEMANFGAYREISDSNLETGRNGSKSGVSWIMRESWQPLFKVTRRLYLKGISQIGV